MPCPMAAGLDKGPNCCLFFRCGCGFYINCRPLFYYSVTTAESGLTQLRGRPAHGLFDVFYRPSTRAAVYGLKIFRSDQQRRARRQIKVTGEGFAEGSVSRMTDRSRNEHMRVRGRENVCEGNLGLEKVSVLSKSTVTSHKHCL